VLGEATDQPWVTERVLLSLFGVTRQTRRALLQTLAEGGRLRESGLVTLTRGHGPLASTFDLAPDVRHVLLELEPPTSWEGVTLDWCAGEQSPPRGHLLVVHGNGSRSDLLAQLTTPTRLLLGHALPEDSRLLTVASTLWRLGAGYGALPALDLSLFDQQAAHHAIDTMSRKVSACGGAMALLVQAGVAPP